MQDIGFPYRVGVKMLADEFRDVFTRILDRKIIERFSGAAKIQERERKKDVQLLLRSMVMAAANGDGGRQASVMRLYLEEGGKSLGRSRFYRWFDERLSRVMGSVAQNAPKVARNEVIELPGYSTKYVRDWHIFDSTTVKTDHQLSDVYPGVGDYSDLLLNGLERCVGEAYASSSSRGPPGQDPCCF